MPRVQIKEDVGQELYHRVKHPTAHGSKYDIDRTPDQVFKLCLLGATFEEICSILGCSAQIFQDWRKRYPPLAQAIQDGREMAAAEVAHSLFQRAKGYSHEAEQIVYDTKAGEFVRTTFVKHYPPDTTAAMHFLTNKRSKEWRNSSNINLGDAEGGVLVAPVINIMPVSAKPAE